MQGLATFLPKLVQNQNSLSESDVATNVEAVSTVVGGGGTVLDGLIVEKFSLKDPGLLKMYSVMQFAAAAL